MNPFDQPPAGSPVSVNAPEPAPERPRRGRTALVAVLTLGLVGGGVAGVSQLASADRPDLGESAQADPSDDTIAPVDDESGDEPADDADPIEADVTAADGQIVIDTGDGDPVVIDLGDLEMGRVGDLSECIGLPAFDLDGPFGEFTPGDFSSDEFPFDLDTLDEFLEDMPIDLDALEEMASEWKIDAAEGAQVFDLDGGTVTVAGPDGVSVVDLGENGSVTVSTDDGEMTVTTSGDATVSELDDLFGEFGTIFEGLPDLFDDEAIADLAESFPAFEEIDPEAVESCLDEVLGD